jgi:hypothetical protein
MATGKTKITPTPLNLSGLPPRLHKQAQKAFEQGDVAGFSATFGNEQALDAVLSNRTQFQARGIYEAAIVDAYCAVRTNLHNWSTQKLEEMLLLGDRQKLLAAGGPLPGEGPFTVYRGVSGSGRLRRVRGTSWTGSLGVACWFALRFGFPNPAVYQARVSAAGVYCYITQRKEQEFVCRPTRCVDVGLTAQEMRAAIPPDMSSVGHEFSLA